MVRTVAKTGFWAGKPLWRCTDFDCPILINIDDGAPSTPTAPTPGGSAQAEFERERAAFRERLQRGSVLLAATTIVLSTAAFFISLLATAEVRIAAGASVLVLVVMLGYFLRYLPNEVVYWGKGAEAERAVGAKLDALEPLGFVTLYDRRIPGRGGNIDAVTVGPPGVFVIETKHRGRGVEVIQGRLEVGGRAQTDPVRQVLELAMLVQVSIAQAMNRHRLTVVPVIAVGNRAVSGGDRAGGVLVTDVKSIAGRLSAEPTVLSQADVQELARLLDHALPAYDRRTR